jgi:putative sigma-54 modulation protein
MKNQRIKIEVRSRGVELNGDAANSVRRHLTRALRRFESHIRGVIVRLSDLNGPKGGSADIECRVVVDGNFPTVIVSERGASGAAAIDVAAERVNHAVARAIGRARTRTLRSIHV